MISRINKVFIFCLFTASAVQVHCQQPVSMEAVLALGLPVVDIETENMEEPTYEMSLPPEGEVGIGIKNQTKVPGRIRILQSSATCYDSGNYVANQSGMTIRVRGNTSGNGKKKPYKIKLQKKADLLDRHNESKYKDKEWLLIPIYTDKPINMLTGFLLNELLELQWTPMFRYVNLYFNGDYRGVYQLTESVKRNPQCRIDVDEEHGYIIEADAYWWNEDVYFSSAGGKKFTFKYPDEEDLSVEKLDYIKKCIDELEDSISQGGYGKLIDVTSFAAWAMGHDLLGTRDGLGSNVFVTKYDDTPDSRLKMGNMWDFDSNYEHPQGWGGIRYQSTFFFPSLVASPDPTYVHTYINLYYQKSQSIVNQLLDKLHAFVLSPEGIALDKSLPYDGQLWGWQVTSVAEAVNNADEWFAQRLPFLDTAVATMAQTVNIPNVYYYVRESTYDLCGRKVKYPQHGIFISNKKKLLFP